MNTAFLRPAFAFGLAMAWFGSQPARAEDWPQFLGPSRNGISTETNLLDGWPKTGPNVVWTKLVGTGYSAPSVRGHRLILHHRLADEEIVECLNSESGERLWRYAYPTRFQDPYGYNNGPRASPVVTANRCYVFGAEGKLLSLDMETGHLVWVHDTGAEFGVPEAFFGVGSSPVLEGDRLLVMVGGQPNAGMVAFDAADGHTLWSSVGEDNWSGKPMLGWPGEREVAWRRFEKQASYATPVLATVHGRRTAFCLMRQGLVSLDPADGSVNFSRWFRAQVDESVNASSPVVVDDLVLITAAYYRVGSVLLELGSDGRSFQERWKSRALECHWCTPIHHQGYLYAFSGRNEPDARFRCVELRSGTLKWDRDESWPPHSSRQPAVYGRGSLIFADGKLIVLGEGGLLGLFRANSDKPEELARWQVPELHYPAWAGPVLAHGRLYLRSEDRLVCLAFSKGTSDRRPGEGQPR